ncbi:MAG: class I adenylate-forming enzyme family protein, partial [Oscillospiraceae bacterium]
MKFTGFEALLAENASRTPDKAAFIFDSCGEIHSMSYTEFDREAHKRAKELEREHCESVAILKRASERWAIDMFGCVIAGKRTILLDVGQTTENTIYMIRHTHAEKLLFDEDIFDSENLAKIESSLSKPTEPRVSGEGELLFFTSGTTELSKAVVLTPESLCSSAWNGQQMMQCYPEDTLLSVLPLNHVFGFVCAFLWPLSVGATIAFGRGLRFLAQDPAYFKATVISAVPSLVKFMVAYNAFNPELRTILVGASPCDRETLDAVAKRKISVRFGYGLTETSSGVAISLEGEDPFALAPCPDSKIIMADDGEIVLRSSCMMKGYYEDPQATAAVLKDGALRTGDLGYLDSNGALHITGRKKDILVLDNGNKIYCNEWEE